jgi:hypothetical protein
MDTNNGIFPSDFYTTGKEKSMLSWYCYEMALGFEAKLEEIAERPRFKKWMPPGAIQPMAIDLSKQLGQVLITKQLATASSLEVAADLVQQHLAGAPNPIVKVVVNDLNSMIQEQASYCSTCPTQCLKHKDKSCALFADPFYSEPLSSAGPLEDELDDLDDEDEYSDEKLDANVEKAVTYWKEFSTSELFSELTESEKEESRFIVEMFAEYMYAYNLVPVEKWNVQDMEEICTDILPRKVTSEGSFFHSMAPVLSAYFQFLDMKSGVVVDASGMASRVQALGPTIVKNGMNPRYWGMAKSFFMAAQEAGYDITDETEIHRAMADYNARLLSDHLAGKKSSPAARNARVMARKVGRNEPCPCGSGLKYKRCCGSNKK